MAERLLDVYLDRSHVGTLEENSGIWAFQYDASWIAKENAYPLSPGLPLSVEVIRDGGTQRPVQWFFDNLLAEGATRDLLAKEAKIDNADAFGLLEHFGSESAGALTLVKPGSPLPEGGRKPLSKLELFHRIQNLPKVSLVDGAPKKMSLAGAQHKLPVIFEGSQLFEPVGSEPSTHILKPNYRERDHYPSSAANEWFVMRLAEKVGLDVPPVDLDYCPEEAGDAGHEAYYLIRRFDRQEKDGAVHRIQSIDACQLLNRDATFKYHEMSVPTLLKIAEATRSRASTRMRLYRWCLFNAIVGNRDAHLKNLSFLVSGRGMELAPHYDLLCTALFDAEGGEWLDLPMSLQFGAATKYKELTRAAALSLGAELLIATKAATSALDQMIKSMTQAADGLVAEFESKAHPATADAVRGGELRVLRQIRHVVMADILKRLV